MLGITTVYVTHDQAEAMALGDRVVVMRNGAIAQIGRPRDIYFAPANRFVAEFIGAANILEGDYADGVLNLSGGKLPVDCGAPAGAVFAIIRPESIGVVAPDHAALCGRVDSVSFIGARQRLSVTGAVDKAVLVDAPNAIEIKAGDRIGLRIDPGAVRLLPRDRS